MAVAILAGLAHDRDDLIDGRRVGGVALALVAWSYAGVRSGHGRRRAASPGSIKQRLNRRHGSLLCESWTMTRQLSRPRAAAVRESRSNASVPLLDLGSS